MEATQSISSNWIPWKIPGSIYTKKVLISCLMTSIFIYHRRITCDSILPTQSVKTSSCVFIWLLFIFWEPLCLPIGIWILHLKHDSKKGKLSNEATPGLS